MTETFYPPKNVRTEVLLPRTASSQTMVASTASATPHTKGAYTQLVAATSADVSWVRLWVEGTQVSATATDTLLDLAVGAAASEVVKLADLSCGFNQATIGAFNTVWEFPLFIPAGSRIAVRNQARVVSDTVDVALDLFYGGRFSEYSGAPPTSYGANAATSAGVVVVAGLSGAEGAWTQITSATTARHIGLLVSVGGAGDALFAASPDGLFDVAVGAPGSEVVIATDLVLSMNAIEAVYLSPTASRIDGLNIPVGSALSVRLSIAAGTGQSLDFCLHGLS